MLNNLTAKAVDLAMGKVARKVSGQSDNPVINRVQYYTKCMLTQDVTGLFSALLEDMDKESILVEVQALKTRHPEMDATQLSALEINFTAKALSGVAVGSGLAWVIPGVALLTGPLAMAGELVGLFVFQSRLVVKIAALHGVDIEPKERAKDIALCVACSTMSSVSSKLSGKAAEAILAKFGAKLAEVAAQKLAAAGIRSIPGIGALAGVVGGAVGAVSNYFAVKAVGAYSLKMYGESDAVELLDQPFDIAIIMSALLIAQAGGDIGKDEKECITRIIEEAPLQLETRNAIIDNIHDAVAIDEIDSCFESHEKEALLTTAVKIGLADGVLEPAERDAIGTLARHLGMPDEYVEKMIDDYIYAIANEFSTRVTGPEVLPVAEAGDNRFLLPRKWMRKVQAKFKGESHV